MKNTLYISLSAALLALSVSASAQRVQHDTINMPWQNTVSSESLTGNARTVTEEQLENTPAQDLRLRLTGLLPGLWITETGGEMMPTGAIGTPQFTSQWQSTTSRMGDLTCIVDDVPIPYNQYLLDPVQIESITVLTSVADKASIGPMGTMGAVYIKTKKGGYNTPLNVHVDVESGVCVPGIWPEWVDGTTYAKLNNQSREASGYAPLYSEEQIAGFALNDPNDILYPNVDYKSLMYKSVKPVSRFGFNANAGSNNIKYNISLSALNDNDLNKIGPKIDYNRINMSSSITAKVGRWIEANASFYGMVSFLRSIPNYGHSLYRLVPGIAFPLTLKVEEDSPFYDPDLMENVNQIYGVSRKWGNNYYALMMEAGRSTRRLRSGTFNSTINVDMSWLLKGLKSKSFINLSTFYMMTPAMSEDYLAYFWDPDNLIDEISTHIGTKASDKSNLASSSYQSLNMYEQLSYNWAKNGHKVDANGTFYISSSSSTESLFYERQLYGAVAVKYSYLNKYFVDLVGNYSGSSRFYRSSRYGFFPALGLSWVASNENFLKDSPWLDRLKIWAQAGSIGDPIYNTTTNFMWQGKYDTAGSMSFGPYSANQWFGTTTKSQSATVLSRIANYDLTWSRCNQIDLGVDFSALNCLDFNASCFMADFNGCITAMSAELSSVFGLGGTDINQNYNGRRFYGFELEGRYHKNWDEFGLVVSGNVSHWDCFITKQSNNYYLYDYQNVVGRSTYDISGYHCLGKFTSEEDLATSAKFSGTEVVGDLKYEDKNGDGIIDSNDVYVIGNSNPKLRYALCIDMSWRNFDFNVVGTGVFGNDMTFTNEYFFNGWNDGNISQFVADNIGGKYPRLTYVNEPANFQVSEWWMDKGSWFKIQSAELGYTLRMKKERDIKFSLRGGNLLTLTNVKYVDPEAPASGITSFPLFKMYTFGVKFNF